MQAAPGSVTSTTRFQQCAKCFRACVADKHSTHYNRCQGQETFEASPDCHLDPRGLPSSTRERWTTLMLANAAGAAQPCAALFWVGSDVLHGSEALPCEKL